MTRKLPWKRDSIAAPRPSPTPRTPVARQRSKADEKGDSETDAESAPTPAPSIPQKYSGRAPRNHRFGSTSPPPEPLQESFMIEGLEYDDGFRMVEDEFLATAQQFTAHLHAAEYQRLKDVAASQNAETIRQISRPVVGSKTELVKKKYERAERRRKQKETRQRLLLSRATKREHPDDESSGADDTGDLLPQNTSLYGLMVSPRKKAPRLDSIPGISLGTRTAAASRTADIRRNDTPLALSFESRPPGMSAAPILDMDDDSDDLEAPGRHLDSGARFSFSEKRGRPSKAISEKHPVSLSLPTAIKHTASTAAGHHIHPAKTETFATSSKAARASQAYSAKARPINNLSSDATPTYKSRITTTEPADHIDSDSDDDPFSGIKSRLAQRLGGNRKQQAPPSTAKPASSSGDYMPGFL